jgi:hypothetical protein
MRDLLTTAHADLPASGHRQLVTLPGIGAATAAVLTAKIVDIERFATPDHLVGYLGIFPAENSSGVDKQGNPLPPGTLRMSQKGNDLARGYLWNAARAAISFNPAVRALHRRLRAKGKRGDMAIGHCMRKLLHLVFALGNTDRPFDKQHYPWEQPSDTPVSVPTPAQPTAAPANEKAAGHTREVPAKQVVTTATPSVEPAPAPVNPTPAAMPPAPPRIDYPFLRRQLTLEQVLRHLNLLDQLHGSSQQRRGPCPIHAHATDRQHTFSVHLGKNVFQCFQADCAAKRQRPRLLALVAPPTALRCRPEPRRHLPFATQQRRGTRKMNPYMQPRRERRNECRHHGRQHLTFNGTSFLAPLPASGPSSDVRVWRDGALTTGENATRFAPSTLMRLKKKLSQDGPAPGTYYVMFPIPTWQSFLP